MGRRKDRLSEPHTVIYAQGGERNAKWHALFSQNNDTRQAFDVRDHLVRMGYPAYAVPTDKLIKRGLPTGPAPGWDYAALTWTAPTDPWAADAGAAP
jgi:hypothetical protein